jgi:aminoglycoside phosphotransferase (APT) family kinase protein
MLVIGWLDGRPANRLVREGQGERAGELAAAWIQRAASLPRWLGPPCGAGYALYQAGRSVAALGAADAALGSAARALAGKLARAQPRDEAPRLVHGTLYDRHLLDLGDGPGVIDWQRAGQGPLELDAGMFLATVWRLGLRDPAAAPEAARAEQAFLAGTAGLIDERALAWHRAVALLRLAGKIYVVSRRKADWLTRADALLSEAARVAERVAPSGRVARAEPAAAPARFALKISALELVLQALSARPATAGELDQIRRLLAEMSAEKGSR